MVFPSRSSNLSRHYRTAAIVSAVVLVLCTLFFSINRNDALRWVTKGSSSTGLDSTSDELDTPRFALIIESNAQKAPNLIPVMLHFASVLGPAWTTILFTLEEHWELPSSPPFLRAIQDGRIEIRFLPRGTQLTDSQSVSRFLTQPWLWEQVESAYRVLLFQLDSMICSKATMTVEDFFGYDFVGAPIDAKYGAGYNGGLSLRNPRVFLRITREADFQSSSAEFEDQWFYAEAKTREGDGVTLPSPDVASAFSVETIYYETPLGYHQPDRWQHARMEDIKQWCPEVGMLISRRAL
ncbi:hypothetical protein BJ170DRAFT_676121 [Xylariales sp. AK1849]|nr:hypothetical protein BJ170DRAFT_676121 [Xylariales sp. AK1849]